jgi:hypothetical protein
LTSKKFAVEFPKYLEEYYMANSRQSYGMWIGFLGTLLFFTFIVVLGWVLYRLVGAKSNLMFALIAALFLSVVTPITIIAIRHQVRLTRIKLIDLFAKSFKLNATGNDGNQNISFEFVKGKYYSDLDIDEDKSPSLADVPRFPMMLHADWMILICAVPYMLFAGFGIFILFAPYVELIPNHGELILHKVTPNWCALNIAEFACTGRATYSDSSPGIYNWLFPSILAIGGLPANQVLGENNFGFIYHHVNFLTIAALAFAGGYFYTLRLLLRAVTSFDLSPITFLRAFAHLVLSVLLAVVIFRVFPTVAGFFGGLRDIAVTAYDSVGGVSGTPITPATASTAALNNPKDGVSSAWLVIAFALGFIPDAAIQYILKTSRIVFKETYTQLEKHAKQIPITILDGVDSMIAFRLEESNIYDVQNLSTFNPIMLHIETPYGIYETIDWVAQAQLCTIVGPERFLLFKSYNIRTIFDLQKAADAMSADDNVVQLVGSILMIDCKRNTAMRNEFIPDSAFFQIPKDGQGLFKKDSVVAMVNFIIDDLHVHRLRQIWNHIYLQLESRNARLPPDVKLT